MNSKSKSVLAKGWLAQFSPPNAAKQSGTGNVQTGAEASLSTSSQVQIPSTQSSSSSTNSSSTNALAAKANEQLVSPAEGMILTPSPTQSINNRTNHFGSF
uniref:Uncharacterized protein n=1 Tax=Ditylenchus dipsaci TaxID=166011 RepID=A0A915DQT3_9BILA